MAKQPMTDSEKNSKYGPVVSRHESSSKPGRFYEVRRSHSGELTCNCPGWANRKTCKHTGSVAKKSA